jgi:hypothetical protein
LSLSITLKLPTITLPTRKLCDNKSVVNNLSSRQELWCTVNQHRHPDVDLDANQNRFLTTEVHLHVIADELTPCVHDLPDQKHNDPFPYNPVNFVLEIMGTVLG